MPKANAQTIRTERITMPAYPAPSIKQRVVNESVLQKALEIGLLPVVAKVLAARLQENIDLGKFLKPSLSDLDDPWLLPDMETAVTMLVDAIRNRKKIALAVDYDSDGNSAALALLTSLRRFGVQENNVRLYIGNRLTEGYGISDGLVDRILKDGFKPEILISADCGSSDEPRIARLAQNAIRTIISDHHNIPEDGYPKSAVACINPVRIDSLYPDQCIAGCMTAFLFMVCVRRRLIELGELDENSSRISDLLANVAVGTISDCMSLSRSINNRAVIQYGLHEINHSDKPCWREIRKNQPEGRAINAETIAYLIGPLTNARGRLDDAMACVHFYDANDQDRAASLLALMKSENERRKEIERVLNDQAKVIAAHQVASGRLSLVIFLPDGHAGVHGISASRLTETFGRPAVIFSPKQGTEELISGSARGAGKEFHVRDAFQWVADNRPGIIVAFGGHKGAAGITVRLEHLVTFSEAFEEATRLQLTVNDVGPVIWTDGRIQGHEITLSTFDALATLEPYGREFDQPAFETPIQVCDARPVGRDGTHLKLTVRIDGALFQAIWFRARRSAEDPLPVAPGMQVNAVLQLKDNVYRGERRLELQILHIFT